MHTVEGLGHMTRVNFNLIREDNISKMGWPLGVAKSVTFGTGNVLQRFRAIQTLYALQLLIFYYLNC